MKKTFLVMAVGALALAAQAAKDGGKNVMDAWFGSVPGEAERLLTEQADKWHFGFRPVSKTATEWLWSDPIQQQRTLQGAAGGTNFTTAVTCCWNYDGFSFVVYTVQPGMTDEMRKGNLPDGSFELYFADADTDNQEMHPYAQFWVTAEGGGRAEHYPWTVYDRNTRDIRRHLQYSVRMLDNGYVHVLTFPWEAFWNKLPLKDKGDNFWRMTVLRWTPQAWQTWGGSVHEASRFGYVRFPRFTAGEKAEIRHRLLKRAWTRYRAVKSHPTYNTPSAWGAPWPLDGKSIREDRAKYPETSEHYTQDPEFYPTLAAINAAREKLAAPIADFKTMSEAEQEAFYATAADQLFNYTYDVEEAYAKFIRAKLFAE